MVKVGDQVLIRGLRGVVRFVGSTKFAAGYWVGIELDEPLGKNDGTIRGISYFKPLKKNGLYGLFAKPETLKVISECGSSGSDCSGSNIGGSVYDGSFGASNSSQPAEMKKSSKEIDLRSRNVVDTSDSGAQNSGVESLASQEERKHRAIIERLQEKLIELRFECDDLKQKLEKQNNSEESFTLFRELESLTIARELLEEEKEQLQQQIRDLDAKNDELTSELSHFKEEVELRRKIDLEEASHGKLYPEVLWSQNELMKDALLKLQDSLDSSNKIIENLHEERDKLLVDKDNLTQDVYLLNQQLEHAQQNISEISAQLDAEGNASVIVESLTSQNYALNEEIQALKMQIEDMSNKHEVHIELEQIYKAMEKELTEQIDSLLIKVSGNEALIESLCEKNQKLELALKEEESTTESNRITESLKNSIAILENDRARLKLGTGFLNEKIKALNSEPFLEYHHQILYLIKQIMNDNIYDRNIIVLNCITLTFVAHLSNTVWRLQNLKLIDEEAVQFIHKMIPLDNWVERCQNKQVLNIEKFDIWLDVLDVNTELDRSVNLLCDVLYQIGTDIIPTLLSIVRDTYIGEDMQLLYDSFQDLEKRCLYLIDSNNLATQLVSFMTPSVKDLLLRLGKLIYRLMDREPISGISEQLGILIDDLTNSELKPIIQHPINDVTSVNDQDTIASSHSIELKDQIKQYETLMGEKNIEIEELMLKIKVLSIKNEKSQEYEETIVNLTKEVDILKSENTKLSEKLLAARDRYELSEKKIQDERLNRYTLVTNEGYAKLLEEKLKMEKLDLISEISDLRRVLKANISQDAPYDSSWLKESLKIKHNKPFHTQQISTKLLCILHETIKNTDLIPIRNTPEQRNWKPRHVISKYYISTLHNRQVHIREMISEYSIN